MALQDTAEDRSSGLDEDPCDYSGLYWQDLDCLLAGGRASVP